MIQEQLNTFGAKYKVCADHEFLLFTISFFYVMEYEILCYKYIRMVSKEWTTKQKLWI